MSIHPAVAPSGAMRPAWWKSDEASLSSTAGQISHSTVLVSGKANQVGLRKRDRWSDATT